MAEFPSARDFIDSTIPVFLVAQIDREVISLRLRQFLIYADMWQIINAFFNIANDATARHEYVESQGTLMHTEDLSRLQPRTTSPVPETLTQDWPFLGRTPEQIIDFALQHLHQSDFSPTNMIILDKQTNEDRTCLLLSKDDWEEDDPKAYVRVRSDFESAILSLMTIETGCGDTDRLGVDYKGGDGVLRISAKPRTQAQVRASDPEAL
jgi:hypothetical protein